MTPVPSRNSGAIFEFLTEGFEGGGPENNKKVILLQLPLLSVNLSSAMQVTTFNTHIKCYPGKDVKLKLELYSPG